MTFELRLKEGEGQNWVDEGGKSHPSRQERKRLKREHTRAARRPCVLVKGESSKRWIRETIGDHDRRALQVILRTLVFPLKWEVIARSGVVA